MDIRKYIYGHCVSPVRVRVWDSYSNQYVFKEVPCGKCLHCRNSHINEWCTRLYAQMQESAHVYYVSLDYAPFNLASPVARKLAAETAATYHNINKNHKYGMQPLLLCRNHLQDFYKRLRKNTGIKLQYFACGEYGSHYSRPHFHNIIFSDVPLSPAEFVRAWSVDGYKIGRVDFNDLVENGTTCPDSKKKGLSPNYVFNYVCKYLQKGSVDFEKMATYEFHRIYFETLQYCYKKLDTLFPELVKITDSEVLHQNWKDYCKIHSPFVCCSRRPAIGFDYLQKNIERFKESDFRLFGLSKDCSAFPRYFVRKAKESVSRFMAIGEKSGSPSSPARMSFIVSVLATLSDSRTSIENWTSYSKNLWCAKEGRLYYLGSDGKSDVNYSFSISGLHFYDIECHILFIFNGYSYTLWQKSARCYEKISDMDILDVLNLIRGFVVNYREKFVERFHYLNSETTQQLNEYIENKFDGSYDKFKEYVYSCYMAELATIRKNNINKYNSHNSF